MISPFMRRVGLGAGGGRRGSGTARGRTNGSSSSQNGTPVAISAPVMTADGSSSTIQPARRGRPSFQSQASNFNSQGATASIVQAFTEVLAQAAQYGVITPQQVAQYQSQANGASNQTVVQLTAQLQAAINNTPSAAAVAASGGAAVTVAPAATSWWDNTTDVFGSAVTNSTLAIGAAIGVGVLYLLTRKR